MGSTPWWPILQFNLVQEHPVVADVGNWAQEHPQLADLWKIVPPSGHFVLSVGEEPLVADLSKTLLEGP